MARKRKKDKRVWVDPKNIVQFTGTVQSIETIKNLLEPTGYKLPDTVKYSTKDAEFEGVELIGRYIPSYSGGPILSKGWWLAVEGEFICLEPTRAELDKHIRVRTGLTKIRVIMERDGETHERLFPAVAQPVWLEVNDNDDFYYGLPRFTSASDPKISLTFNRLHRDAKGAMYYDIDRQKQPDFDYDEFIKGD